MPEQIQIEFDLTLTTEESDLMRILGAHRGKLRAIKGKDISEALRIGYDAVRALISHVVNDHHLLIASCGKGYYIPQTVEEIGEATKSLRHRGISILVRAARLQSRAVEDVFNQSRIEFMESRR
jgi:hypothetical protein